MSTKAKVWLWIIGILIVLGMLLPKDDKDKGSTPAPARATFDDSNVPQDARDSCAETSLENGNGVPDQERGLYIICINAVQAQQNELSSIERNN